MAGNTSNSRSRTKSDRSGKYQQVKNTQQGVINKTSRKDSYVNRDSQGKFTAGSGGLSSFINLRQRRILPVIAIIALVGGFLVYQSFAITISPKKTYDLRTYYPNRELFQKQYLEGNNYIKGKPERSVLWFEKQDQYTFKMYNAAPQNADRRCNYDVLSWWPDSTLRYSETYSNCGGYAANKIVYDSPIIFLPATWDSREPWQLTGSSTARYYEVDSSNKMKLRCTGNTTCVAKIIGLENVTPKEQSIRWQTSQTTNWKTGSEPGKCTAGYITRWIEDYWLSDTVKSVEGSKTKGLRRTKGGSIDYPQTGWDVWYDGWSSLPSIPASSSL